MNEPRPRRRQYHNRHAPVPERRAPGVSREVAIHVKERSRRFPAVQVCAYAVSGGRTRANRVAFAFKVGLAMLLVSLLIEFVARLDHLADAIDELSRVAKVSCSGKKRKEETVWS
ncbi:hypothetical protein ACP70R_038298 [Stipagrostis hirtigluma subsp. patula]